MSPRTRKEAKDSNGGVISTRCTEASSRRRTANTQHGKARVKEISYNFEVPSLIRTGPLQAPPAKRRESHRMYLILHDENQAEVKRVFKVCIIDINYEHQANKHADPESSNLPTASAKRSKKPSSKKVEEVTMKDPDQTPKEVTKSNSNPAEDDNPSEDDDPAERRALDDDDDEGDNPFRGGYLGGGASMSSTLRALSGYVSGLSSRLREILNNLRQKDDPSVQLIALQELSEILLISNEDNLSGHFSPDQFVKELVILMQPPDFGQENSEMMLLACRCLANLMEALPQAARYVAHGGAVPVLCQKLLEIQYIDLAEQALITMEKISAECPETIVEGGGLTACLTFLDFFATSTQRTAVTTAANCCKHIPQNCFATVRDVMPILQNVLGNNDQKVVEQGSLCVSRIIESFKYQQDKLEELVKPDLLRAMLRLLQPGTTNLIGPNIHTQFLRVLSITARASPALSAELLKMDIVDTLYQILTGVSPPSGTEDVASQIDSVFIMQALIHRPREQISETLNVICELLPAVQNEKLSFHESPYETAMSADGMISHLDHGATTALNAKRVKLLEDCKDELKRFALVLFPTLTDAYSSTVNLVVRQKVLLAQLKMLSNLDTLILEDALRTVPYASYLASILSQEDHPTLVMAGLKAADLLLNRLQPIYGYQFYREGVMAEVSKLANRPATNIETTPNVLKEDLDSQTPDLMPPTGHQIDQPDDRPTIDEPSEDGSDVEDHGEDEEGEDENDDEDGPREIREDVSPSPSDSSSSSQNYPMPPPSSELDVNVSRAKKFLEVHENAKAQEMRDKASAILLELQTLASNIENCYLGDRTGDGADLFTQLSKHFHGDALQTITSSELLHSEIVRVLLDIFSSSEEAVSADARTAFLEVFMTMPKQSSTSLSQSLTPFSVFIHKLQDLLSRAEHFEVVTVSHSALDNNRSSPASMLSKQLRLKLIADDDAEMPRPLSERPRSARHREGVSNALAAFAAAAGVSSPHHRLVERGGSTGDSPFPTTPSDSAAITRATRKAMRPKNASTTSDSTPAKEKPASTRRSSRRHQASETPSNPPAPIPERVQTPLECADERQLSDEDDMDDTSALDAIVDDLEDSMEGEQLPEPTAVNMEIASTGKVTARKEDGTRIATPSQSALVSPQGPPGSRSRELLAGAMNPLSAGRAISYAAAIQTVPQDWHIEFSIDDQPISNDTTIYRAVHYNRPQSPDPAPRNVWSAIHTVKFKRVSGPPPPESRSLKPLSETTTSEADSSEENRRDRHRDDRPFMGRLQRQKVRISRNRMLESAMKVMELYGGSSSVLEVEYFEEVGTGLGPTLEFYSTVSKEFSKKRIKLWRENDSNENEDYAFGQLGMFPAPMTAEQAETEAGKKVLNQFKMLGKFIARSMLDSRIIDVSLNPTFFRIGDQPSTIPLSLGAVKTVDSDLAKSLKILKQYANAKKEIDRKSKLSLAQRAQAVRKVEIEGACIEDLSLDFTLPGYPAIELIPDGANTPVNLDNVGLYIDKVIDMTLGSGVQRQVDQFRSGFSEVFPYSALKAFTPSELVMLFGRVEEDWSIETLLDSIKADHGFNMDSKSVRNLLQTMSELLPTQRRDFLQFVTGSPKLPIGGFKSLNPMFTVVCKPSEPPYTSDDFLISVMTCANYVKLPDYSSIEVLRKRLLTAIQEGQGAFHLS
ncbi:E3 ubiquitin-protein ligase TRIP12, partial [Lecanoromycetidae sp. Uapishka_2]